MRAFLENPPLRRRGRRISRRVAARRAGAAGVEGAASNCLKSSSPRKRGPITTGGRRDDGPFCCNGVTMTSRLRPGVIAALAVLAVDQATKLWLLFVFDIAHRGAVKVTPFFDLVLAWNVGMSLGWFQNDSQIAQIALMLVKAVAVVVLA